MVDSSESGIFARCIKKKVMKDKLPLLQYQESRDNTCLDDAQGSIF